MTLADALRSWYFENMSPLRIVEACATPGFACGARSAVLCICVA
jgi:hypothetical protein